MEPTSHSFPANVRAGLADPVLQRALGLARTGFPLRRQQAIERLPEFEALREEGRQIKDHTLAHLDFYLELTRKMSRLPAAGALGPNRGRGARRGARDLPLGRRKDRHQRKINGRRGDRAQRSLEANGITPIETDLGEYIIQLRHEPPSHIIAPAIHLMKEQVADAFRAAHTELDPTRALEDVRTLCEEARTILRRDSSPPMSASPGQFPGRRDRLQHHRHQ